jgi:hypothetical protein
VSAPLIEGSFVTAVAIPAATVQLPPVKRCTAIAGPSGQGEQPGSKFVVRSSRPRASQASP